jgi:hypothetical protein
MTIGESHEEEQIVGTGFNAESNENPEKTSTFDRVAMNAKIAEASRGMEAMGFEYRSWSVSPQTGVISFTGERPDGARVEIVIHPPKTEAEA